MGFVWRNLSPPLPDGNARNRLAEKIALRAGDLLSLKVRTVRASTGDIRTRIQVKQGKTKNPVTCVLGAEASKALSKWIDRSRHGGHDYLFSGRDGKSPLSRRQFLSIVKTWVADLGLPPELFGTHSLRRTKASMLYASTKDSAKVQIVLGQSTLSAQEIVPPTNQRSPRHRSLTGPVAGIRVSSAHPPGGNGSLQLPLIPTPDLTPHFPPFRLVPHPARRLVSTQTFCHERLHAPFPEPNLIQLNPSRTMIKPKVFIFTTILLPAALLVGCDIKSGESSESSTGSSSANTRQIKPPEWPYNCNPKEPDRSIRTAGRPEQTAEYGNKEQVQGVTIQWTVENTSTETKKVRFRFTGQSERKENSTGAGSLKWGGKSVDRVFVETLPPGLTDLSFYIDTRTDVEASGWAGALGLIAGTAISGSNQAGSLLEEGVELAWSTDPEDDDAYEKAKKTGTLRGWREYLVPGRELAHYQEAVAEVEAIWEQQYFRELAHLPSLSALHQYLAEVGKFEYGGNPETQARVKILQTTAGLATSLPLYHSSERGYDQALNLYVATFGPKAVSGDEHKALTLRLAREILYTSMDDHMPIVPGMAWVPYDGVSTHVGGDFIEDYDRLVESITEGKKTYLNRLERQFRAIAEEAEAALSQPRLQTANIPPITKGEFEKLADFEKRQREREARIAEENSRLAARFEEEVAKHEEATAHAKNAQAALKQRYEGITEKVRKLDSREEALRVLLAGADIRGVLGVYDAEAECFPFTFTSSRYPIGWAGKVKVPIARAEAYKQSFAKQAVPVLVAGMGPANKGEAFYASLKGFAHNYTPEGSWQVRQGDDWPKEWLQKLEPWREALRKKKAEELAARQEAERARREREAREEAARQEALKATMVKIIEGNFLMGEITDPRKVEVSEFYMAQNETCMALWNHVRFWATPRGYTDLGMGKGKGRYHPVCEVSWYDVVKWCNARSEMDGLKPCYHVDGSVYRTGEAKDVNCDFSANGYRLPTEAEWEKAARGGLVGKNFPWGDRISHVEANFRNDGGESYAYGPKGHIPTYDEGGFPYTSPVGSFAANGYGLYDMAGNMEEWCWDLGSLRVVRGGCWFWGADYCRAAHCYRTTAPANQSIFVGFRVARSSVP